ncbi:MAG TPA: LytTR family DNA-binding domain-containing protein [Bacillota bacterium]|nr:LytTR family DNA-binding domain-containing protein [Bacillota bacterium]
MNIAICDDNPADAAKIHAMLLEYFEQAGFTGDIHIFKSGEELFNSFSPGFFDAYFLDIYMSGISGVEAARRIRRDDPFCALVFITSSDGHMRDGYSLRAASYVEKPITPEKMDVAFQQCYGLFLKKARYIEITFERQSIKLPLIKILYAEVWDKAVSFHTTDGKTYKAYMTLDEVEHELGRGSFLRCHRSCVVNMNHVTEILEDDLLMRNGEKIPLRKNGRRETKAAINDFFSRRLFEVV